MDQCTHDTANHVIECTGGFPASDPTEMLSTHATFYVEGTCNLYPDPPEQLTVAGAITYSDGDESETTEPIPVAPTIDLTVLPDAPANGGLDVIIEAADGSGPVLQWHDQTAGLACGRPSAMDPEQHDITYGAYLHKADEPLQEEDVIGDEDGDPAFVDATGGDYHIGAGSAARDAGASAGVRVDLDGAPRDAQPDIGAYEYR